MLNPASRLADLPSGLSSLLPEKARSFSFAARFLPATEREDVTVLYAFCRTMDDLVDEPPSGLTRADIQARITLWRSWFQGGMGNLNLPEPVHLAVALDELMGRTGLPARYLVALLDGVESDLEPVQMADFIALRRYCLRVAGAVGMAMCHILSSTNAQTLLAAAHLGIAMQLTNILRDLGSDVRGGRMYLPADELARFGCSMSDIVVAANERSRPSKRLEGLLRFQVTRARTYYESGLGGIWFLPPRLRPAILIAGRLYRAILDEIENSGYDVLRRRAYTYPLTKVREAAMAFFNLTLWSGIEGLGQRNRLSPVGVGTTSPNEALTEVLSWLE